MKRQIITLAAAVLGLAAVSCGRQASNAGETYVGQAADETVTSVAVAQAVKKDVPQDETYSSTVQANVTNNIAPQTAGRIRKINVEVGDFVSAGQILAEMDRLQLDQAKLKLVNDSTELTRLKALYEQGGLSQADYEAVELAYKVSKSTYSNLLENTILRSPVSGVVTARNYDKGDLFGMSQPLFVVQQITPVKVLVGVSESDYTKVKRGDEVKIKADAVPGQEFVGKVNRIYPTINPASHTFQVEVLVANGNRLLRPGMYVKADMTFAVNNSVVVPDEAVVKQQGSGLRSVFVVKADNTVESRVVTLGRHTLENEYEILEGLDEGETVVVKGQTALKNGSKVTVL